MEKTTKEQILSGLRIGGGLGAFLIAAMLIGLGRSRVSGAGSQIVWRDWLGWTELISAVVILVFTARIWQMALAGYLLFGTLKGLFLFTTGSFPSHGFSTRGESLLVSGYCLATLMLMYRFVENPPTLLDRVALTLYLFCLWPTVTSKAFSWWPVFGLGALVFAWGFFRWRSRAAAPAKRS